MRGRVIVPFVTALAIFLGPSYPSAAQEELDEFAETDELDESEPEQAQRFIKESSVSMGGMLVEQTGRSSKFNEYKDDSSRVFIERLLFGVDDTQSGAFFDFRGRNLGRDDQNALLELGWYAGAGRSSITGWSLDVSWSETPHLLSNSARTPYDYLGGGRYQVARSIIDAAQISNISNAASWTAPDAGPGMPGEDLRIARVLGEFVRPIDLGTQRETGTLGYNLLFSERTQARLEFKNDAKNGSIGTGAGLGDRPPRSVNIQLPERIDYNTSDFKASLEHVGRNYHVDASWLYSQFENDIDTLTWNSLFHAPGFFTEGATDYDGIRIPGTTLYGTNGAIALSPDNTAQQFAVNGGINLPFRSSLTASVAYGAMKQDENLLPYATSTFGGTQTPDALPRSSADAEIETAMFNIVYAINPLNRVSTRFHYRYYDLDNKTDQEAWFGNTQDTSGRFLWDADIEDRTSTLGLGLNYAPVEAKYALSLSFSHSRGVLDIDYAAGAAIVEDDTTNVRDYAEWTVPADARFKTNTLTFQYRYSLFPLNNLLGI